MNLEAFKREVTKAWETNRLLKIMQYRPASGGLYNYTVKLLDPETAKTETVLQDLQNILSADSEALRLIEESTGRFAEVLSKVCEQYVLSAILGHRQPHHKSYEPIEGFPGCYHIKKGRDKYFYVLSSIVLERTRFKDGKALETKKLAPGANSAYLKTLFLYSKFVHSFKIGPGKVRQVKAL